MGKPTRTQKCAESASAAVIYRDVSPQDLAEIGRHARLDQPTLERLGSEIAAIVGEIREAEALPPERRRELRKQKLKLLRKISKGLGRLAEAVDQAGVWEIGGLDGVLAGERARFLSSTAV